MTKGKLTANEISDVILESMSKRSFSAFLTSFSGQGFYEADVFGINNNGYMYEYEIKRSRGDFLADFKNKTHKHNLLKDGISFKIYDEWKKGRKTGNKEKHVLIPNRFFFACEPGLIDPSELPEYCGLVYIKDGELIDIKNAKLIHKEKANQRIYKRIASALSQRMIYGCSYYTYKFKNK
jgi:hypothetical protein